MVLLCVFASLSQLVFVSRMTTVFRLIWSPSLWQLIFGYRARRIKWPTVHDMEYLFGAREPLDISTLDGRLCVGCRGPNPLSLGMSRYAYRDALQELLHCYNRNRTHRWHLGWLKTHVSNSPWSSYDVIAMIQTKLARKGLG